MFLSRFPNTLVARCTLLALLFCHGFALANASVAGVTGVATAAIVADCHSVSVDPEVPGRPAANACDWAQAASDTYKLPAVTLAVLATAAAPRFDIAAPVPAPCASPVALAGAPPPLHLLHCRLRN